MDLALNDYRHPWGRRAWLRLLACTCGQVRRVGREIMVTRHVCRDGHVVGLPGGGDG